MSGRDAQFGRLYFYIWTGIISSETNFRTFVTNIFDFLVNLKYSSIYSDKDNKKVIDTYISIHITMDDVLDRINENKGISGFKLFPIEKEILSMA